MKKPYFALVPSGYKFSKIYSILPVDGSGDLTFARTSESTRVAENGLIQSTASGLPTMDWLNSDCPSFKMENLSTNLQTYSEDFTQSNWITSNANISSDITADPKGIESADKLIPNTTNTFHHVQSVTSGMSNYQPTTYSIFVKKAGLSQVELLFSNSVSPFNVYGQVKFDLDTLQTFGTTIGDFEYQDYGNGWYRLAITGITTSSNPAIVRAAAFKLESQTFTGNDVDGLFVWGAQVEINPIASSYIYTANGSGTRSQDTVVPKNLAIDPTKGTFFLDLKADDVRSSSYIKLSGTGNNRITCTFNSSEQLNVGVGNAAAPSFLSYNYNHNSERFKVAIRWADFGVYSVFINGVKVYNLSANQFLSALDYLSFNSGSQGSLDFSGEIYNAQIYTENLTDAEIIKLTTI
tara:strand:+ start:453 stop:1676 length:1224 start_codon:yes stop_codon:yes gene_type:complete